MLMPVILAAELLVNGSLDQCAENGSSPARWALPKDAKTEYREIAYLSENMVVSVSRGSGGMLLEQTLVSPPADAKSLTCSFDAVPASAAKGIRWEVKGGVFRLFSRGPLTVQLDNLSLQDKTPPLDLKLKQREALPAAEGAFPERVLHVYSETRSDQRVLLFTDDFCADWAADDLRRQFGFRVDTVVRGAAWDPKTVQERFNRGEYVLLFPGGNPVSLEKNPNSAVAEYIRRGGRAVYCSPRRGGTWGKRRKLPDLGIPYERISPARCRNYGIACLSEGPFGKGTVVELGLNVRIYRSGIWPAVDEIFLVPELHDLDERARGFPYNEYYSLLYADLILGTELKAKPWTFRPDAPVVPPRFDSKLRFVAAGYLWTAIPYRAAFYPVMRQIGLNCINCWAPGAYDAAKHGWPWTDGWGGIMENEGVVGAALQEQGIWGRACYGNDPVKKHWRSGCLSDPKWKDAAYRGFRHYAECCRANPPFAYALTDEMTLSAPWMNYHAKDTEPCRMPHCMARFRAAMREKFRTISALNERWGTSFASFDDIKPALTPEMREARRAGNRNYARWLEFRLFMDDVFAGASDAVVAAIDEENPDIATGQPNWTWMTPMAGIDPSKIVPGRTGGQDYGPSHLVRSFRRKGTPIVSWFGYGNYSNTAMKLWGKLNMGATGVMMYNPVKLRASMGEGFLSTGGQLTEDGKTLRDALRPIVGGCGDLVNFSERAPMPVTVLYSQAGMGISWLESDDRLQFDWEVRKREEGSFYMDWFRSQEQWEKILGTLRLGFDYTTEAGLERRLRDAKALVLPETWTLSEGSRRVIRAFRERGGLVIGDVHSGVFYEDGVPAPADFTGELDLCLRSRPRVKDRQTVEKLREAFASRSLKADYEIVQTAEGDVATGITCGDFRVPGGRMLIFTGTAVDGDNVMTGTRPRATQPDTDLELRLDSPAYLSDMVRQTAATEKTAVFRWNPRERPCALFISGERPAAPEVSCADGVWTARAATPRVLHRAVYDADGREIYRYRANSPLTDEWRFRLDLPAGARLVVRDSATGLEN